MVQPLQVIRLRLYANNILSTFYESQAACKLLKIPFSDV